MDETKTSVPNSTPVVNIETKLGKDNVRLPQMQIFYDFLHKKTATYSMVSESTGLRQKNCTRYKRKLEKNGYLWEVYDGKCRVTGLKAAYLTTNPSLNLKVQTPKLF